MGCNLWFVEQDIKNTLILGADVFHSRNDKSVAALVGQFGKNLRHIHTETSIQSGKYEEIINAMAAMFLPIIERYQKVEKSLPEKIIYFRDGVGQGFIETLVMNEVKEIISVLEKKYAINRPKITVVLVTKRIADKFSKYEQKFENPLPGTVIESSVIEPDSLSFFMISHKANQGSANPTKYQVVYDESTHPLEKLIQLSMNLCWSYFNWQGPIKVPSPVQYAHKSAFLIGELQDSNVKTSLKNSMYYL